MISPEEMSILSQAGSAFRLSDTRQFYGSETALPLIQIDTPLCRAIITLQGAQLLSFQPAGMRDLLWLSPLAEFREGSAIRGGVPICAPWFGVNRQHSAFPKHGFLRNRNWTLTAAELSSDGAARLELLVESDASDLAEFSCACRARLILTLSTELTMTLCIENTGSGSLPLSFAFHSYFRVDNLNQVRVTGLEERTFLDNCKGLQPFVQNTPLDFRGEVDRVFEQVGGIQRLCDGDERVVISGEGCNTVIVWNPGEALAAAMVDVGPHFKDYVCVERGAAFADEVHLGAGESCSASMTISADKWSTGERA